MNLRPERGFILPTAHRCAPQLKSSLKNSPFPGRPPFLSKAGCKDTCLFFTVQAFWHFYFPENARKRLVGKLPACQALPPSSESGCKCKTAFFNRQTFFALFFRTFFSPPGGRPLWRGGCKYRAPPAPVQGPRRIFFAPLKARPGPQFGKGATQAGPSFPNPGISRAAFGSRTRPQGIIFLPTGRDEAYLIYMGLAPCAATWQALLYDDLEQVLNPNGA